MPGGKETRRLRWGILGTGHIAARFAGELPLSERGELVAVASRSADQAVAFAERFAAPRSYGTYEELLEDPLVEAVYVATPHTSHARWAIAGSEHGLHVLCEKPLTLNHAEAMAVVEAAQRSGTFLMEAFMYRCHPQTLRIAEMVRDGAIGTVRHVEASFGFSARFDPSHRLFDPDLGGGAILDVGCYPISMVRMLAGSSSATGIEQDAGVVPESLVGVMSPAPTGVDGMAAATLLFKSGVVAQVAAAVTVQLANVVRVHGSTGSATISSPWTPGAGGRSSTIVLERHGHDDQECQSFDPQPLYAGEADAVADAVLGADPEASGRPAKALESPCMPWRDSLANMATLDRWRETVGSLYPSERAHAMVPTVLGRPLARRMPSPTTYGTLPGIGTPISRLVMGVDNQLELTHGSVMFDDFFERGGSCFDTAYIYGGGRCEEVLGRWLESRGVRDEVVIIGKGGHTPHCDPASVARQLIESLERLGTDHVDLYFLHRDNPSVPVGEFVDVLETQRSAGLLRAYGGSNWTIERLAAANRYAKENRAAPMVALSNQLSLAEMLEPPWAGCVGAGDQATREWLASSQIALFPWSSQAHGLFALGDHEMIHPSWSSPENSRRRDRARQLARSKAVAPTAIALAWVLNQAFQTFPLIGPRTIEETRVAWEAFGVELSDDEVRWLEHGEPR